MNELPILVASLIDRMLGLDESMSLAGEQTALGWEHPLPGWAWLLIVLAALMIGHASYARLAGARWARMGLATFRALLLIALAVLLAGPTAVRTEITPEPDWLLVMVDRSASMQFEDTEQDGEAVSRDTALRRALDAQLELFGDGRLGKGRNIAWFGYDREAYPIDTVDSTDVLGAPDVQATNLRTAIDQALQAAAGRSVSGLVLIGDGQSPQPTGEAFTQRLARQDVPVFAVPLGSAVPRLDLAVGRVDTPVSAFAGDLVPVTVTVRRQDVVAGEDTDRAIDPAQVRVRLIDADSGELLDDKTLAEVGLGEPLLLQARAEQAGALNLRVEVSYEGEVIGGDASGGASSGDQTSGGETSGGDGAGVQREIAVRNNRREVSVAMVDRPMKVLYVEGAPRWEYRYLVSMLKREQSIDSSILLTNADRGFVQEGDTPIARFPQTAEEIRPYDVIIIGDVHPRFFSERQRELIREHVATRGAGLLWIGGERHTPNRYAGTALELLLPMVNPSGVGRLVPASGFEVPVAPTRAAEQLSLLRLSLRRDDASDAGVSEWPDNLPAFRWAQDLGTLRPGARPLANAVGLVTAATGEPAPLVVLYRFAGGEVIYVGSDETWRWRRAGGEVYFEQFWIQLIRKLGRTRVQQLDDRARFTVAPPSVDLGATQLVELTIDDPALLRDAPPGVAVKVFERLGPTEAGKQVGEIEMRPAGFQGDLASGARAVYQANWRADRPGRFLLKVTEPLLETLELTAPAEVRDPAEELARAATDHDRLARLANATAGAVIPLNDLARLERLVPDRSREITSETRQPLTNTLLALCVLLGLLTLEWALRRGLRLV